MTGVMTNLFMAILATWAVTGLTGYLLPLSAAFALGAATGLIALTFPKNPASRGLVSLLDPIGVVLPFLALRHMASWFGFEGPPFSFVEMLLFLVAYLVFLAAATDKLPFDPYRLGYAPIPVALIVLAICGVGILQGSLTLPILAILAQLLWVLRVGSSNYFDHVLHATLVPVVAITLAGQLF